MRNSNERHRPLRPLAMSFQLQIKDVLYILFLKIFATLAFSTFLKLARTQTAIRILTADARELNYAIRHKKILVKDLPCEFFINDQAVVIRRHNLS